jgi:hypothetical protein
MSSGLLVTRLTLLAGLTVLCGCPVPGGSTVDAAPTGPIVTDGGRTIPFTPGTCSVDNNCGGELYGTWEFFSGCVLGEDKKATDYCALGAFEIRYRPVGTVQFNFEGTYTLDVQTGTEGDIAYPGACFEGEPSLSRSECNNLGAALGETYDCTIDNGAGCHCQFSTPFVSRTRESGIFIADGGLLLLGELRHSYCVSGKRMTIKSPVVNGEAVVYTLFRSDK